MATNEELLDILIAIRATGQAEATAVNEILANTGNVATNVQGQVQGLTKAQAEHAAVLQTANSFTTNYGGALTAQEASYARLQLAGKEVTTVERDLVSEGNNVARAASAIGVQAGDAGGRLAALGGVMGSTGMLGLGMGAAIVGAGGVVVMGKSMIDNADQNEAAQRSLGQAFESQGKSLQVHQTEIDGWIEKNARFLSSEYDAKNSVADFTRAGFDWTMTQRLMNDALDLSTAKHVSLADATKLLIDAENGRAMGLLDLGISIKSIQDPNAELVKSSKEIEVATTAHTRAVRELQIWEDNHHDRSFLTQADLIHEQMLKDTLSAATGKLTTAEQDHATAQALLADKGSKYNQVLDQIEAKTKDARKNQSDLQQSEDQLRITWQKMSDENGPALAGTLNGLLKDTNNFLEALRHSDDGPDSGWGHFQTGLIYWLGLAGQGIDKLHQLGDAWNALVVATGGSPSGQSPIFNPHSSQQILRGGGGSAVPDPGLGSKPQDVRLDIHVTAAPGLTLSAGRLARQLGTT